MLRKQARTRPDYLVIGHISKDLPFRGRNSALSTQHSVLLGGTATYSAVTAQRLGLQAAVVTAYAPEDELLLAPLKEAGVWVHAVFSHETTTFRNVYTPEGKRTQTIMGHATPIAFGDVPPAWRDAPIVHLGPVAQELAPDMASSFPNCLLGVTPQGWLRSWNASGHVRHSAWPVPPPLRNLPPNAFLVLSLEDLGYKPESLDDYVNLAQLTAITQGSEPAYLCANGQCVMVPAFPARPIDPTGAGDVFAAALFIRYRETSDLQASARFAHAAAALSIGGQGISAIPDRRAVEAKLKSGV